MSYPKQVGVYIPIVIKKTLTKLQKKIWLNFEILYQESIAIGLYTLYSWTQEALGKNINSLNADFYTYKAKDSLQILYWKRK